MKNKKVKMLNRIIDWDFNPLLENKVLTINPIGLIISQDILPDALCTVIEKHKHREFDLLKNDSYPVFSSDNSMLLCGNRAVAHALVDANIAQLPATRVNYPIYY